MLTIFNWQSSPDVKETGAKDEIWKLGSVWGK